MNLDLIVFYICLGLTALIAGLTFHASMAEDYGSSMDFSDIPPENHWWKGLFRSEAIMVILALVICIGIVSLK